MSPPAFCIRDVSFFERDVRLRLPFRFGVVTLTEATQVLARVRIDRDGRHGWGAAAELMAPKWFDKDPRLSNADNVDQLRLSLCLASQIYRADEKPRTAFGHFAAHDAAHVKACREHGLNALVAGFGPALIDRAALDALCRMDEMSFYDAVVANRTGITAALTPELADFAVDDFLSQLTPRQTIFVRHTVGLVDALSAADVVPGNEVDDGLPQTLEQVVAAYRPRYFKLKVGGRLDEDIDRLCAIAAVLDRLPYDYAATLDGNEQYDEVEAVAALWRRIAETPRLKRLAASILLVEQPLQRKHALTHRIDALACLCPVIIDESDSELDAFVRARDLGYRGVSSKTCKGIYRSLLNAARCRRWNAEAGAARYFMSGEDLTTQAGVAVQQDTALVALLGLEHVERNGHHYVDGFRDVSESEQRSFLAAHPDLYRERDGIVRLRIEEGRLDIASLACPGFAHAAEPDWPAMRPMPEPAALSERS